MKRKVSVEVGNPLSHYLSRQEFDGRSAEFSRCRALVLQAVNSEPGCTYVEIRAWIQRHKRFTLENVGGRVRELARDVKPPLVRIVYDEKHTVHVYPVGDAENE